LGGCGVHINISYFAEPVLLASTQLTFARMVGVKRSEVASLVAHRKVHSE
jgi:hypothetical protein